MTSGYYCAIFPFCGGGKKKTTKKQRHFMTGLPQVPSKKNRIISEDLGIKGRINSEDLGIKG